MKRLKLLTALTMGIMASASGVVQVQAATYNYFVDFSTKEVANFTAFRQSFSSDTYNLDAHITMNWQGTYRFDSCPTAFTVNAQWITAYTTTSGAGGQIGAANLPDFTCTTSNTTYFAESVMTLPAAAVLALMNDDGNSVPIQDYVKNRYSDRLKKFGRGLLSSDEIKSNFLSEGTN